MAVIPLPILDYSDKDEASLRIRMHNLIKSAFPEWTDEESATFGNLLVDLYAFVGGVVTKYQDNQANEAFLSRAQLRRNVLVLARQIGYAPHGLSASQADELFQLAAVPGNDVTIPAGTIVKTADVTGAVEFQLLLPVTIPAGTNPPEAYGVVENSENQQDTFTSSGLAHQEFTLSSTPYIDDSAIIAAGNGVYTVQPDLLDSTSSDLHVTIVVDDEDRATLRFGNGTNGAIPTGTITVDYKTGGGRGGNVEPNTINRVVGTFTDVLANPVTVTVTNPAKATGGENRQSIASIKERAPASLRVLNRTVAREDFEINALRVAGVARALMLTADQGLGIAENNGRLYIIPTGGGLPTQTLKDAVKAKIDDEYPSTITFQFTVVDPAYLDVDVSATIFLRPGYTEAAAKAEVEAALEAFFAESNDDGSTNTNVDFGYNMKNADGTPANEIALSDVFNVVRDASSIRKIGDQLSHFTLNGFHEDVTVQPYQFPRLGTVALVNGATGQVI